MRIGSARWVLAVALGGACARPEPTTVAGDAPEAGPPAEAKSAETPATVSPPPPRTEPVACEQASLGHEAARAKLPKMSDQPVDRHALVHFVPLERGPEQPPPMQHFHTALRDLAAGKDPDGKVRVAFYGASSVAADRYTSYLRHYLQARFGDGGPGFVAMVPLWRWHRHEAVNVEATKHWTVEHAQRKTGKLDGLYGLLGASTHADHKRARTMVVGKKEASPVSSVELWYLAQPGGGSASLKVMGRDYTLSTKAAEPGAGYFAADGIEEGPVSISLQAKGDGEVRLLGAVLERAGPGVVVDALGIGGTRAANMVLWDEPLWREGIARRAPDLWVLAYGANEAVDEDEPIEVYRDNLEQVITRLQAAVPDASCLLIGPVDFPMQPPPPEPTEAEKAAAKAKGKSKSKSKPKEPVVLPWIERPRCTQIIEVQRELAAAHGCGFFDEKAMMGGNGSMEAWATADPPLAKPDHLHFTPLGYAHLGRVLSDALMADYDDPPGA